MTFWLLRRCLWDMLRHKSGSPLPSSVAYAASPIVFISETFSVVVLCQSEWYMLNLAKLVVGVSVNICIFKASLITQVIHKLLD